MRVPVVLERGLPGITDLDGAERDLYNDVARLVRSRAALRTNVSVLV